MGRKRTATQPTQPPINLTAQLLRRGGGSARQRNWIEKSTWVICASWGLARDAPGWPGLGPSRGTGTYRARGRAGSPGGFWGLLGPPGYFIFDQIGPRKISAEDQGGRAQWDLLIERGPRTISADDRGGGGNGIRQPSGLRRLESGSSKIPLPPDPLGRGLPLPYPSPGPPTPVGSCGWDALPPPPKTAPRPPKLLPPPPRVAARPPPPPLPPRRPQDSPKTAQEGPKTAQDGPRRPQDGAKAAEDGSKTVPRRHPHKFLKPKENQ